jgi:cyclic pyranopterin phosphate synthase
MTSPSDPVAPGASPRDRFDRPLRSLRVSVTDRCNLRCTYCMPEADYTWLPREDILTFAETEQLVRVFVDQGVSKLRITGGEPLLRRDLPELVARLARVPGIEDVALTTNAVLLPRLGGALREAGVQRVTVSLDTLRPDRFTALSGRDHFAAALAGIEQATRQGFAGVKLNMVVMRGRNDDELLDMLDFGRRHGIEVRFIEYMDVGGATRWSDSLVVSRREMLERIGAAHGTVTPASKVDWAPADLFRLADGTTFGVISSTTEPFCRTCDRARLTADGMWFTCLYARGGINLRDALRAGATPAELAALIGRRWRGRDDRGAEQRRELAALRGPLAAQDELAADPHLEMHKRGG